ncbi:exonuclease SbcCD subunit D C-terminal domain-containing protein [Candidatus Pantoea bituminis]|uniref:exonuclease SbcCD subunit D C-terminal domain-containing protein n=1 Tax=Candidatus Pantoea bituminis TaxID=2831036 RepID=UPI002811C885|nr:exonuclease SbcCD subunit D C-terminal domain-containing protein [Pantoea bituminis]
MEQQLAEYQTYQDEKPVWLDIEVTTQEYLSDLQRRVEALTAELPVEVLLLRRSRELRQHSLARLENETLSELKVEEVFARRLALDSDMDEAQLQQLNTLFRSTLADIEENT